MYLTYYGMEKNPFVKEGRKTAYESKDYRQIISRLKYLTEVKGIGLVVGEAGSGKTYAIRKYAKELNEERYKIIYISLTEQTNLFNFFKTILDQLDLTVGACYSVDMYNNIQNALKQLVEKEKKQPIIIIDDAHLLSKEIIKNFKVFYDFEMDSKDYVTLVMVGYPNLAERLKKEAYDTLKQRIIVNYICEGLTREEVKEYVNSSLKEAKTEEIFTEEAINALYSSSDGIPRQINVLALNSLMIGYQMQKTKIDSEIVMMSKQELDLKK